MNQYNYFNFLHLFLFMTQMNVLADYNNWITVSDPKLPRADEASAIGYDETSNKIWIVGGYKNAHQLVSYDTSGSFIDYTSNALSHAILGFGQFYTVTSGSLWMIDSLGFYFNRFIFQTETLRVNYHAINQAGGVGNTACLTSFLLDPNTYLVVNGGYNGLEYLKTTHILNIVAGEWIQSVPDMMTGRERHVCIVAGDVLYSIGGYDRRNLN
eukprot:350732_1